MLAREPIHSKNGFNILSMINLCIYLILLIWGIVFLNEHLMQEQELCTKYRGSKYGGHLCLQLKDDDQTIKFRSDQAGYIYYGENIDPKKKDSLQCSSLENSSKFVNPENVTMALNSYEKYYAMIIYLLTNLLITILFKLILPPLRNGCDIIIMSLIVLVEVCGIFMIIGERLIYVEHFGKGCISTSLSGRFIIFSYEYIGLFIMSCSILQVISLLLLCLGPGLVTRFRNRSCNSIIMKILFWVVIGFVLNIIIGGSTSIFVKGLQEGGDHSWVGILVLFYITSELSSIFIYYIVINNPLEFRRIEQPSTPPPSIEQDSASGRSDENKYLNENPNIPLYNE